MKKLIAIVLVMLLAFSLTACTIDLGNGVYVNQNGVVKGSENIGLIDSTSKKDTDESTDGDSNDGEASSNKDQTNNSKDNGNSTNSSSSKKPGTSSNSSSSKKPGTTTSKTPTSTAKPNSSSSNEDQSSTGGTTDIPTGEVTTDIKPLSYAGLSESAYVTWSDSKVDSAEAWYKPAGSSSYTKVADELVRADGSGKARVDILGLKAGKYDIRVHVGSANKDIEISNVAVTAYDRSGYAHFGYTKGVGAYNDDGTLKSGVSVIYIDEATKNTAGGGIVKALNANNVCIRILGRISCPQYLSANKLDTSITDIKNIIRKNQGDDSYWNMIDISGRSNVTVEGVGANAEFYQFGLTFKGCQSIEVRNLTFTDYPEDACSFEGNTSKPASYKNFWIHNNLFNVGKNGWDLTTEQDKHQGDGATDVKGVSNVTFSYNKYSDCKKTGLVGGDDTHLQSNITAHHNYYYKTNSRTPLARQANLHYYNNYFDGCISYCMSIRANAYMFSEANYVKSKTFRDGNIGKKVTGTPALKSFNDKFDGCSKKGSITVVTDRAATVKNSCTFGSSFDTDSSKFYYDASAKKTKVSYLTNADTAKSDCMNYAGPGKANR